jgi:hypothetical protein
MNRPDKATLLMAINFSGREVRIIFYGEKI